MACFALFLLVSSQESEAPLEPPDCDSRKDVPVDEYSLMRRKAFITMSNGRRWRRRVHDTTFFQAFGRLKLSYRKILLKPIKTPARTTTRR